MIKTVKHYKGQVYDVLLEGVVHSETGEELSVYRNPKNGKTYARPTSMFFDLVEKVDRSGKAPRFETINFGKVPFKLETLVGAYCVFCRTTGVSLIKLEEHVEARVCTSCLKRMNVLAFSNGIDVSPFEDERLHETPELVEFDRLRAESRRVFAEKNATYGGAFELFGLLGVVIRIGDKLMRAFMIIVNGAKENDERLEDTLKDMENYATIARLCHRRGNIGGFLWKLRK